LAQGTPVPMGLAEGSPMPIEWTRGDGWLQRYGRPRSRFTAGNAPSWLISAVSRRSSEANS
jgi:hypothetical protein